MTVFVQLPERWGDLQAGVVYREGFAARVRALANPATDQVVILEPNPWIADDQETHWGWFPHTRFDRRDIARVDTAPGMFDYFFAREDAPLHRTFTPERRAVERRFPLGEVDKCEVETVSLNELLNEVANGEPIALLSVDGRMTSAAELATVDWARVDCRSLSVTVTGLPRLRRSEIEAVIKGAGFLPAGRPWGAAGDTYLFERPAGLKARARAASAQAKVKAGEFAVMARDEWVGPSSRKRWESTARVFTKKLRPGDILNPEHSESLESVTREEVEAYLARSVGHGDQSWMVSEPVGDDPMQEARQCHERHGVWPISFSYPRAPMPINEHPSALFSPITPGFPYSYESERDYLGAYEQAYLGITHRKAGWDCFRHVEILASGAVPLMLDAEQIPRFSMVHYPKHAMVQATEKFMINGGQPTQSTREQFRRHFDQHLTTRAMASYLLAAAGLEGAQKVLFVDERLAGHADYLSVMTLIGLKQLLGDNCLVQYPVDYIYEDTTVETKTLYGRGFGYTRALPPEARSDIERASASKLGDEEPDVIVIGSVTRNAARAAELLARFPAGKTIWIHGEDMPPTPDEVRRYRQSGTHVFVRAIHSLD